MKNLLLILLGIALGLGIGYFLYGPDSYGPETLDASERESFVSFKGGPQVSRSRGEWISPKKANKRLNAMKDWKGKLRNKKKVEISSGYSFGLDSLKELIKRIDTLNKYQNHQPGDPITGVRAHLSLIDTTTSNGKNYKYLDVFLSPVQLSGRNYVYIDEKNGQKDDFNLMGGDLILNQSNPCPEYCDGPGLVPND